MQYLYQIFYDQNTFNTLDSEFLPIENTQVTDSTWYEYPAIIRALNSRNYDLDDYIGIFSPRFNEKTGMTGADVKNMVGQSNCEVISFSPNISDNSLYQNSFFQGEHHHPGLLEATQTILNDLKINIDISKLWQDQSRIIFSNYFVAKYRFWKVWLELYLKIYSKAESKNESIYPLLNKTTTHRDNSEKYQYKIFVAERLVSLVLEMQSLDAKIGLNLNKYLRRNPPERAYINDYIILDSLKGQFTKTNHFSYELIYKSYQKSVRARINKLSER